MNNSKSIYLVLSVISAVVICFEIISTRISSVIFVQNYAFIILSLAILGLGSGGIFSYYKIKIDKNENHELQKTIFTYIILTGASLLLFIFSVILLVVTNPFIYFFLLLLPFFFAGVVYAQIFKSYADNSFKIYASDLAGASLGSAASIGVFVLFSAPNAVLFLSVILIGTALSFAQSLINKKILLGLSSALLLIAVFLILNGEKDLLGKVPIGDFPDKDFYHVYDNLNVESKIIDSRWSIYGRSDLVEYNHQDVVKQIFIDGSAGSQMYKFNGSIANHDKQLNNLLLHHSTAIPFLFLRPNEKNEMLVIGPGGGKEILTGLLGSVQKITGVEVNPDFVDIVKKYKNYNGGIYTNFPNVDIQVAEGRHFVKRSKQNYDIICMALPSTAQLQNIDGLASNENYLLTVEAIKDYLKILTPEGRLILTVHNRWELIRMIVTTLYAFKENGIVNRDALDHFIVLGEEYAPTIVIKKDIFTKNEIVGIENVIKTLPEDFPHVTFLPFNWERIDNSIENVLLKTIRGNQISLEDYIAKDRYDISPVRDDSPYFYKVNRGVPGDYSKLLITVFVFGLAVSFIPLFRIKTSIKKNNNGRKEIVLPLAIFISIGIGFMILEVSLFQKLVLYLGSPTITLSILLGSLLIGMGTGSFFGGKIYTDNLKKRLSVVSLLIVAAGVVIFIFYPLILNALLSNSQVFRSIVCFFMILPFGFLLGIPFPSCLQLLKQNKMEKYIPWMYGVNGIMSVAGSILAVILSMIFGFTPAFFIGLCFYLFVFVLMSSPLAGRTG